MFPLSVTELFIQLHVTLALAMSFLKEVKKLAKLDFNFFSFPQRLTGWAELSFVIYAYLF